MKLNIQEKGNKSNEFQRLLVRRRVRYVLALAKQTTFIILLFYSFVAHRHSKHRGMGIPWLLL
jgi:hypothetical protein